MSGPSGPIYATVSDNQDPEERGRVKVSYNLMGDTMESDWMDMMNLYNGAFFLPEVGDQVVVAFIAGSYTNGVVLGGVWSDSQKPPETKINSGADKNKDGKNNLRFIKTRSEQMIIFDDTDGDEKIQIMSPKKVAKVEFLAKKKKIIIESKANIEIDSAKKIKISADTGELKFKKELKIEADNVEITSSGKNVKLKADQNIEVKGQSVKLN